MMSCSDAYDDTDLANRVTGLENRVKSLEEQCKQLNTNITSIQTLINAVENGDAITSVTPIKEGDKEVGYTFSFAKSPAISVYHGKDGQNGANGSAPVIGIKQDDKGNYCWTLNGEWLLDNDGQKLSIGDASGSNEHNGIVPQFKIENDNWYISLDNNESWVNLSQNNNNIKDCLFSDIDTTNPAGVTFTLADGSSFTIPRQDELNISFDKSKLTEVNPNTTYNINYVVEGNITGLKLEIISSGNVKAKLNNRNSANGTITITTGDAIDEYDKVILLASNGRTTVMNSVTFVQGDYLQVTSGTTYQLSAGSGIIDIELETNTDYTISIPNEAKSWISVVESRAIRQETISLKINWNGGDQRSTTVHLVDKEGNEFTSIEVRQAIAFPDENFRKYILNNFDSNKDGIISENEVLDVTQISASSKNIKSLEGIQYFSNLKTLGCSGNPLSGLNVSKNIALTSLGCQSCHLSSLDVSKNTALETLGCDHNQLTKLDLSKNINLSYLYCANNQLSNLDVSNTKLEYLSCENNLLTSLDVSKTHLNGNTIATYPLNCYMPSLNTLYLKNGWKINGINLGARDTYVIHPNTEIRFSN